MSKTEEPTSLTSAPAANTSIESDAAKQATMALHHSTDPALLTLLVCPFTRATLGYDAARQELISRPERLAFPIRDGVPILVREEGRSLDHVSRS